MKPLRLGGQVVPPGPFMLEPLWRNFFENPGLVQFIHRCVSYLLLVFTVMAWMKGARSANRATEVAFQAAGIAVLIQLCLGIYTVVSAAPWQVAILHQAGAIVTWVAIIRARFAAQYPAAQSVRG